MPEKSKMPLAKALFLQNEEETHKICRQCGLDKPIDDFRIRKDRTIYRRVTMCWPCEREYKRQSAKRYRGTGIKSRRVKWPVVSVPADVTKPWLRKRPYKRVYAAWGWPGGKYYMANRIIEHIPYGNRYVDVFGGAGSILLALPRYPVEIFNDLDRGLVNMMMTLADEEMWERLKLKVSLTPYSREVWDLARTRLRSGKYEYKEMPDLDWAYTWYIVQKQSFGGNHAAGWGVCKKPVTGWAPNVLSYLNALDRMEAIHNRIMSVQVENLDFRKIFEKYDNGGPDTVIFCDPDYPNTSEVFVHSMTEDDHHKLTDLLLRSNSSCLLTTYYHESIHGPLMKAGWKKIDWTRKVNIVGKTDGTGLKGGGALADEKYDRVESMLISPIAQKQREEQNRMLISDQDWQTKKDWWEWFYKAREQPDGQKEA